MAKLSQKPAPHATRRRRADSSTARGRLSQIAEAARPSRASAVGRSMSARGLLNVRLRERDDPDVGRSAPAGREGNFSSLQTLENKRNRIGIPPNPPPFRGRQCEGGDYLAEPKGVATRPVQGRPRLVRNRNDGERRRFPPVNPSYRAVHAPWRRVLQRKTACRSVARRRPAVPGGRSHCAYSPS